MEFVSSISSAFGAGEFGFDPVNVPARGYVRHVWARFFGTGGNKTAGVASADFPFDTVSALSFFDVGGGEILVPMSAYELFLVNKYGGYVFAGDPTQHPDYSADLIAFNFALRIPFEISHSDGLGALSNQNSQSKYKMRIRRAADTAVWSTPLTADPTLNIDVYTELWSQPPDKTDSGVPILNRPPLLGTTQYWTRQFVNPINAGAQNFELDRRGNQDRMYILIWRDNTGARSEAVPPDPVRFVWDSREQFEERSQYRRQIMRERYGVTRTALDTGVYVYDNAHDVLGHPGGMDDGHLWYRTKSTSRLEFRGNVLAAGSLTILHNDVAPVAVTDQYSDVSGTGGSQDHTV